MKLQIYSSKLKDRQYVTDLGVKKLCELVISMPDLTGGLNREVEVKMEFGKSEVKIKALDVTSNKSVETKINWEKRTHCRLRDSQKKN